MASARLLLLIWLTQQDPIAYAFLVLSLYGAFLSYIAAADVLRIGPLDYVYSKELHYPVLVQFWTLVAGLICLGIWLFQKHPQAPLKAVPVVMLGLFLAVQNADAQTGAPAFNIQDCVHNWYQDRFGEVPSKTETAVTVLGQLQTKKGARQIVNCVEADSVLDELRFAATNAEGVRNAANFTTYLDGLQAELGNPGLGTSKVVDAAIALMSPWDQPVGTLMIRATKGTCQIWVNDDLLGITNWSRRLVPGSYRIRVARNFQQVFSDDHVSIVADDHKVIDVDGVSK